MHFLCVSKRKIEGVDRYAVLILIINLPVDRNYLQTQSIINTNIRNETTLLYFFAKLCLNQRHGRSTF